MEIREIGPDLLELWRYGMTDGDSLHIAICEALIVSRRMDKT